MDDPLLSFAKQRALHALLGNLHKLRWLCCALVYDWFIFLLAFVLAKIGRIAGALLIHRAVKGLWHLIFTLEHIVYLFC